MCGPVPSPDSRDFRAVGPYSTGLIWALYWVNCGSANRSGRYLPRNSRRRSGGVFDQLRADRRSPLGPSAFAQRGLSHRFHPARPGSLRDRRAMAQVAPALRRLRGILRRPPGGRNDSADFHLHRAPVPQGAVRAEIPAFGDVPRTGSRSRLAGDRQHQCGGHGLDRGPLPQWPAEPAGRGQRLLRRR